MRVSKLIGILFLVAAVFVATRGVGWHFGTIAGGMLLGVLGLALVSRREVRRFRVEVPRRRNRINARAGRVRAIPAPAK